MAALIASGAVPVAAQRSRLLPNASWFALRWIVIAICLVVWQFLPGHGGITNYMLPPLTTVLARIGADAMSGELFVNAGMTLYRTLLGFLLATLGGVAIGVAMTRIRAVRWFLEPLISLAFPMPKIVFLPVIILWLGVHDVSKVSMVVCDAIFPVITATMLGMASVDRQLVWAAQSMGASRTSVLWQVELPAAWPRIMTGLQVALPISLIVVVVGEMLLGGTGLGASMNSASRYADSPGVYAGLLEVAVIGFVLVKGMARVRARLLAWHPESTNPDSL